jgi:CheY-like chemotaxis protein
MKYLLIDDLADFGWKSILEKAIIKSEGDLEVVSNYNGAIEKIQKKFDIFFLDVRLTEEDHSNKYIYDYTGFKILKKIKQDFTSINFSTPIFLLTASTRIWYIEEFIQNGVDSFYIKEHPDNFSSETNSRDNLLKFQSKFIELIKTSKKRNQIWQLSTDIICRINEHEYFKNKDDKYYNVKARILDKLMLGYSILFQQISSISNEKLLANNETMSFIVYFSIFEEISKGFTKLTDTWNDKFERKGNWKFRNNEYFIEIDQKSATFKINYLSRAKKKEKNKILDIDRLDEFRFVSLSEQIYALFAAYNSLNLLEEKFKSINKYRNEVDYIHSSIGNIYAKKLISPNEIEKSFEMNFKVLSLIKEILLIEI